MSGKRRAVPGMPLLSDCTEFARMVERHFSFLEAYGLRRAPEYDTSSPVLCQVAYSAETFLIILYLDIRDNYVGASVMTEDRNWIHLSDFLKSKFGYIEKPSIRQFSSPIETYIAYYKDLLRIYSDRLFSK